MDVKSLIPWRRDRASIAGARREDPSHFLGLHRQVNRLFDDFFRDFETPVPRDGFSTSWPSVEVSEGDKEVKVVAELPGLDERDIDVSLREGILTLSGEKKRETSGAVYSERWHGQFTRSIDLGADVDPDKVSATFNRGVLTITLEKRQEAQTQVKRIAINREN
jgi:HSP20 family protein